MVPIGTIDVRDLDIIKERPGQQSMEDATVNQLQPIIEILPKQKHLATLIYLHGIGDNAKQTANWIRFLLGRDLHINNHVKVIMPTAPKQPFSPLGDKMLNIWYNSNGGIANINTPEKVDTFVLADTLIADIINSEIAQGIPLNKIIVGGFSMGASYALHVAYRIYPQLVGVFAFCPFVTSDSAVYKSLERMQSTTPLDLPQLLAMQGEADDLLLPEWGVYTYRELTRLGVRGEFHAMFGVRHEIRAAHLLRMEQWARQLLPSPDDELVPKL